MNLRLLGIEYDNDAISDCCYCTTQHNTTQQGTHAVAAKNPEYAPSIYAVKDGARVRYIGKARQGKARQGK